MFMVNKDYHMIHNLLLSAFNQLRLQGPICVDLRYCSTTTIMSLKLGAAYSIMKSIKRTKPPQMTRDHILTNHSRSVSVKCTL